MKTTNCNVETKFAISDLNIDHAVVYLVTAEMTEPFSISLGTQYDFKGVFVELVSGKESGYGECSTIPEITGEFPEAAFETAKRILMAINSKRFEGLEDFSESINSMIYSNSAVKNAIEMAGHDLYGKVNEIHLTKMLGASLVPKETSMTITLGSVNEALESLSAIQKLKAKDIKMKVGIDPELDIKRIKAVSEKLEGEKFYVDANQGYSLQDAMKVGKVLNDSGAAFFEQPLNRHDFSKMAYLRKQTGVPLMLDESISNPRDVIESIIQDSADYINVKLAKSGGVRRAMKVLFTAQAYGINAMVGCMIESKLGIAASMAVALSANNVKFYDLDGFHFIKEQPFKNGIEYRNGINTLYKGTGIACERLF